MKLRKLLPILGVAMLALTGCSFGDETKDDGKTHTVEITNKEELGAEWHVGDPTRNLVVSLKDDGVEANTLIQIAEGNLKVESSNANVLAASGLTLNPVGEGQATITVKYFSVTDTIEFNIQKRLSAKDRYETVHTGFEDDPLDNTDANKVGAAMAAAGNATTGEAYYIKGKIKTWYHFPGERTDKITSWYLEAQGEEKSFEVYKCVKADGEALTVDEVWKGAEVTVTGKITVYNGQAETSSATFVKSEGEKPAAPEVKNVTVAQAIDVAKALDDGDTTWDIYNITGYVVNVTPIKEGINTYYLADSKTELTESKMFQLYSYEGELNYQAKVVVQARIKNYHKTYETNVLVSVTKDETETGGAWPNYPEPELIKNQTLADLFNDTHGNYKVCYEVTGVVKKWDSKNGTPNTNGTDYGNFYLTTNGEDEYYIYGATAISNALAWNKIGNKYVFTNPKDFLKNDTTKAIAIGDTVTMKLVRCDYTKNGNTTKEACGIVTSVTPKASA